MKKIFIILFFLITYLSLQATTYYVATTGNDANAGTIGSPWKSWNYGFNHLSAGDILYIRGGTYTVVAGGGTNKFGVRVDGINGTSTNHITVSAYPGEVPILDGSACNSSTYQNVGIGLYNMSYWDLIGLTVTNFVQYADNTNAAPGFYESTVYHITHTQCTIYRCGDGFTLRTAYDDIHYTNCDVIEIADRYIDPDGSNGGLPGGLANGYYASPAVGTHIYYTGCRAINCSDDGWDQFGGAGYIDITNCWAIENGYCPASALIAETSGDGSGFKLGPTSAAIESGFQRTLKSCLSIGNYGTGIDMNSSGSYTNVRHAIYNSVSAYNTAEGFQYYYDYLSTIRNCIAFGNGTNPGDVANVANIDHNSWQNSHSATTADFTSVDVSLLKGVRQSNGDLPLVTAYHLVSGSDLRGTGISISGLTLDCDNQSYLNPPSMGAFEYYASGGITIPTITTTAITDITSTTATGGGIITSDGGATVTTVGLMWSTSPNQPFPTLSTYTSVAYSSNTYTDYILIGVTANTLYYVKAYATNSFGTGYGNEITFTSLASASSHKTLMYNGKVVMFNGKVVIKE